MIFNLSKSTIIDLDLDELFITKIKIIPLTTLKDYEIFSSH